MTDLPPLRDDGLPTLATGEPVLHRWFVLAMLALVPVALGVTVWAWTATDRSPAPAVERRLIGSATVTIDRGAAARPAAPPAAAGPAGAAAGRGGGDAAARAAGRRALAATCTLLRAGDLPAAADGLAEWTEGPAVLRLATFERAGVDASVRREDGAMVMELNARYAFEDAARAAPAVVHQLGLIADPSWPGAVVGAGAELAATRETATACARLSLPEGPPRSCLDADEVLAAADPYAALVAAGFRDDRAE
ncbi:MAG: hypothetical protein ACO3RG_02295 [Nitriliruptoraceae bacterium]